LNEGSLADLGASFLFHDKALLGGISPESIR
jgi:hypothetical protein